MLSSLLLAACLASACASAVQGSESSPDARCRAQILLQLRDRRPLPIPAPLLAELAGAARVHLDYLRMVGSGFQVLRLASDEPDADCAAALTRLRADARVGSVELDARRQPHG